jgi:hypothetical protein
MLGKIAALPLALSLLLPAWGFAAPAPVDPAVTGTWQMLVPGPQGIAQWIWDIHSDGTYRFRSEGGGSPVPAHSGTAVFQGGHWRLNATQGRPEWHDEGTYLMGDPNLLVSTGVLGTGVWDRVIAIPDDVLAQKSAVLQPAVAAAPDVAAAPPAHVPLPKAKPVRQPQLAASNVR